MKRKNLLLGACAALVSLVAFGVSACGGGHTHAYEDVTTAPTCTEQGYTTHTCACGDSYVDSYVDELGHDWGDYTPDNNATYNSDGTKTARCERQGCSESNTVTDAGTKLPSGIRFKSFDVDGLTAYGVVSNATTSFRLSDEIEICGNATCTLVADVISWPITTSQSLKVGENVFTVKVRVDGQAAVTYQITIKRRAKFLIRFETDDGEFYGERLVEEDSVIQDLPQASKDGYTFVEWDYDFSQPITSSFTTYAQFNFTGWNIRYNSYGFDLPDDAPVIFTGEERVELPTLERAGYDFLGWFNGTSYLTYIEQGTEGSLDLSAEWQALFVVDEAAGEISNLTKYAQEHCTKITVPAVIDGVEIVSIASIFDASIEKVVISEGVRKLGEGALSQMQSLKEVELPSTITEIGDRAFWNCVSLQTICIPAGVEIIGEITFFQCKALEAALLPQSLEKIEDGAFSGCEKLTGIQLPSTLSYIGDRAFLGCKRLGRIDVPNGVSEIGESAFSGCESLQTAVLPQALTTIQKRTFDGCVSLVSVQLPAELIEIGSFAFLGCASLVGVQLPAGLIAIGSSAFENCASLAGIDLPEGLTTLGDSAFSGCAQINKFILPNSLTEIGDYVFSRCSLSDFNVYGGMQYIGSATNPYLYLYGMEDETLKSVTVHENCRFIGDHAFYYADVSTVLLPNGLLSIGGGALSECRYLTSIDIPSSVTNISDLAFAYTPLQSVVLPSGLKSIEEYVFCGTGIKEIVIPSGVTSIGRGAFFWTGLKRLDIPANVTEIHSKAFENCSVQEFSVAPDNPAYKSVDGVLYTKDGTTLIKYPSKKAGSEFIVPDTVTTIGEYAFDNVVELQEIKLYETVAVIKRAAFTGVQDGFYVYSQAPAQPEGWQEGWIETEKTYHVVWGASW